MKPLKIPTSTLTRPILRPADFRQAIVQAELDGLAKDDMVLRLTLRDESELKRDPAVKVEEISFANGEMRFLGVKVVAGGIAVSALDRGEG